MTQLVYFSDPGHGWLRVDSTLIQRLRIEPSKYSYEDKPNHFIYLEEDFDALAFLRAATKAGLPYKVVESTMDGSFIRSLPNMKGRAK